MGLFDNRRALVAVAFAAIACGSDGDPNVSGDGSTQNDGGLLDDSNVFNYPDGASPDASPPPAPVCDPSCVGAGGQCTNGVCTVAENPGNVDGATQTKLKAGGTADSAFAWLYPYDRTVFPRGLLSPTMQFGGTAWTAAMVTVTFKGMSYQGFFGAATPARLALPAASWKAIAAAATAQDAVDVEVTKISNGAVTGPIKETWTFAQGSLRGTIYYETYNSGLAGAVGIMKIQPGSPTPTVVKSGCGNVCHTASADGSTLVAAQTLSSSASYNLKTNATQIRAQNNQTFTYGALYPDGSFLVSATNYRTWNNSASQLYNTTTGAVVPATGWTLQKPGTPAFSPDGKMFALNHEDTGAGHTLAVMNFNNQTKTFSGLTDIANAGSQYVGWPAFTPDAKWVLFHEGSNPQFETDNNATGDLFMVDVATHTVARLDALDGYKGAGPTSYLPANDPALSFAPTVLPVAVGGYFWAVFTTHRSYGNTLASKDKNDVNGKLWVSAIDLSPTAGKDASHPAFYLDGQELSADNLRGFWVLDPCKADGNSCTTGDECCGGFCRQVDGGFACVPPPGGCSQEYEKCNVAADCCSPNAQCINGHCATPPPN
ncbi:MAG TPA: hypothetical protein VF316_20995 [Polyangiaceae bacterium]